MAKRQRTQTRAVMENRERQGRGRGDGREYKPWLYVQDVPSKGRSSRIASGGRVVHTLSDWETAAYRDFQWDPNVVDVKEQYPLELRETERIAAEIKVEHPADGSPRENIRMTTDFLVTYRVGGRLEKVAYTVKERASFDVRLAITKDEVRSARRVREKFEIERRYWVARGVRWEKLTDEDLSKVRKGNIEWIMGVEPARDRPPGHWRSAMAAVHAAVAAGRTGSMDDLARALDAEGVLARRDFPTAVRLLCARRAMAFEMDRQFTLSRPVSDFAVAASAPDREAA